MDIISVEMIFRALEQMIITCGVNLGCRKHFDIKNFSYIKDWEPLFWTITLIVMLSEHGEDS